MTTETVISCPHCRSSNTVPYPFVYITYICPWPECGKPYRLTLVEGQWVSRKVEGKKGDR